jgi:hypothetical protein
MDILRLTNIEGRLKNGSTLPLLINALKPNNLETSYVLKTYKHKYNESNFTIAKEIIISELAKKFDLNVPDYGLIKIEKDLLLPHYSQEFVNDLDNGYKFCTEYVDGAVSGVNSISKRYLDNYEYSKLFAFDHLLMNGDRGRFNNKPNLLYTDTKMILIDHEITLPFYAQLQNEANYFNLFQMFFCRNHIFWSNLNKLKHQEKINIFDEFIEILRNINFDFLNFVFDDLDKYNIPYGEKEVILGYLYWAKTNYSKIHKILNQKI